jgi:hypothetical protein
VEAFFDWWERDLHRTLQELRITGGEPLMSGYTWKLIEWFKTNQGRSTTRLAINSNLGIELPRMMEFADAIRTLPEVELYTSMEATWAQAEYIRDGLDFNQWFGNMLYLLEGDFVNKIHVMGTINALCLTTLVDNLNMLLAFKQKYGRDRVNFTLNILRFPSFQSALVLPDNLRNSYRLQLEAWLFHNRNNPCLHEHEINHVQRLIDYLDIVKTPHSEAFELPKLINDFRQFYTQYDQRRGKNFDRCFPELSEWYGSIQI